MFKTRVIPLFNENINNNSTNRNPRDIELVNTIMKFSASF